MDTTALPDAYRALLDAAATVADAPEPRPAGRRVERRPDPGARLHHQRRDHRRRLLCRCGREHHLRQPHALDSWSLDRVIALAGGNAGLRERIRRQGEALCALGGPALSETELDTAVPARLLSNGEVLVDQPLQLRDILTGLAEVELPGHTRQLLALLPDRAGAP